MLPEYNQLKTSEQWVLYVLQTAQTDCNPSPVCLSVVCTSQADGLEAGWLPIAKVCSHLVIKRRHPEAEDVARSFSDGLVGHLDCLQSVAEWEKI